MSVCWCVWKVTKNGKSQPRPIGFWYMYPQVDQRRLLTQRCLQVKQLRVLLPTAKPWVQSKKSRKVMKKPSRPVQSKARERTTKAKELQCRRRRKLMGRRLRYCELLRKLHL